MPETKLPFDPDAMGPAMRKFMEQYMERVDEQMCERFLQGLNIGADVSLKIDNDADAMGIALFIGFRMGRLQPAYAASSLGRVLHALSAGFEGGMFTSGTAPGFIRPGQPVEPKAKPEPSN